MSLMFTKINGVEIPIGDHLGKTVLVGSDPKYDENRKDLLAFFNSKHNDYFMVVDAEDSLAACNVMYYSFRTIAEFVHYSFFSPNNPHENVAISLSDAPLDFLMDKVHQSRRTGVFIAECDIVHEAEQSRKRHNSNLLIIRPTHLLSDSISDIAEAWLKTKFDYVSYGKDFAERVDEQRGKYKRCL